MSASRDRPSERDDLEDRLDELDETLTDLRRELRAERRRTPPKPPSLSELLQFTEQYTIPTLIALLEATIQSLELLRRTLRLADPERAVRKESETARSRLDSVGAEASGQLAGALSELRTALSEADLPENPESRRLIDDARELTGEIEGRLREAEQSVRDQQDRQRRDRAADRQSTDRTPDTNRDRGVMIDVTDAADGSADQNGADGSDDSDETPQVDVESELESIKDELDRSQDALDEADKDTTDAPDTTESDHSEDEDGDGKN